MSIERRGEPFPTSETPDTAAGHIDGAATIETADGPVLLSDGTPDFWALHPDDIQPTGFMEL